MKNFLNKLSVLCIGAFILFSIFNVISLGTIKQEVFRLHVVANSNSEQDLLSKLKVSETIENYLHTLLIDVPNKKEAMSIVQNHVPMLEQIAKETLIQDGIQTNVTLQVGNIYYDSSKENYYASLPKGNYDSLKITIGQGKGENFWNFIFPKTQDIENLEQLHHAFPTLSFLSSTETKQDNDNKESLFKNLFSFLNKK